MPSLEETKRENRLLFGISSSDSPSWTTPVRDRLNAEPFWLRYPHGDSLFLVASGVDVFEAPDAVIFKIGFLRTSDGQPLSAAQLSEQRLADPQRIQYQSITGNGIVGSISRQMPRVSVYATPTAIQRFYWKQGQGVLVCSTDLCQLLNLIDDPELDELATPNHFLLISPLGSRTCFRGIHQLEGGHLLTGGPAEQSVRWVRTLNSEDAATVHDVDGPTTDAFFDSLQSVMNAYLQELQLRGAWPANLLSGGIDSSLVQVLIDAGLKTGPPSRSFSYSVDAPAFQFEIDYAAHASDLLGTQHTFHPLEPEEFNRLLERTIRGLGQPTVASEVDVALAAVGDRISETGHSSWIFTGEGADSLLGLGFARKLRLADLLTRVPASAALLRVFGAVLEKAAPSKGHGLKDVGRLIDCVDAGSPFDRPTHRVASVDLAQTRRCFGDRVLLDLLEERLVRTRSYVGSSSSLEISHAVNHLFFSRQVLAAQRALYARKGMELVPIYLDQEVIRLARRFHPRVRFIRGYTPKPILKLIIERRGLKTISRKKKGGSTFRAEVYRWMADGPIRDRVHAIKRPPFLSQTDFDRHLEKPGSFLWSLLTFDIFERQIAAIRKTGRPAAGF